MKKFLLTLVAVSLLPFTAHAGDVYDRVMKAGVIRCGYIPYPPAMIVDPNTGTLSGVFYDFMNEVGNRLSLKVEWVQESGWGTFINDLKSDRFDMMCSAIWTNSARAREADHTTPLYYSAITAWVKSDDKRFDKTLDILNDPAYSIATIDGETGATIAKMDYPKAKTASLPEMASMPEKALTVSTGKADVAFFENYTAQDFLKTNPGTLKSVGDAVRLYGNAMYIKKGEHDLRLMVNDVIDEISNSDFLPELFKKYDVPANSYFMPAKPYGEGN